MMIRVQLTCLILNFFPHLYKNHFPRPRGVVILQNIYPCVCMYLFMCVLCTELCMLPFSVGKAVPNRQQKIQVAENNIEQSREQKKI